MSSSGALIFTFLLSKYKRLLLIKSKIYFHISINVNYFIYNIPYAFTIHQQKISLSAYGNFTVFVLNLHFHISNSTHFYILFYTLSCETLI